MMLDNKKRIEFIKTIIFYPFLTINISLFSLKKQEQIIDIINSFNNEPLIVFLIKLLEFLYSLCKFIIKSLVDPVFLILST